MTGATVADTVPAAITSLAWTCVASAGSSCPASGSGNIGALVNLLVGGTATFTLTGTVSAGATGNLVNTATIAVPPGTTDPTPGNNTATDTDTPNPIADLAITKTDGSATYTPGNAITYTIVATNNGPSAVTGATVADTVPAAITSPAWTCVASAGSSCPASGSGNIGASVNLLVGGTATFTLTGTVSAGATGNLVNTATVAVPPGTTDPTPGNNTRDRHRHRESGGGPRDHQDRRHVLGHARHADHLYDRRQQQRAERRHRRDGCRHGARDDHRRGLDVRRLGGEQLSRLPAAATSTRRSICWSAARPRSR